MPRNQGQDQHQTATKRIKKPANPANQAEGFRQLLSYGPIGNKNHHTHTNGVCQIIHEKHLIFKPEMIEFRH